MKVKVEVVSDVMLPWCWVGKRNLETAMGASPAQFEFEVVWRPFFLRPNMPDNGVEKPPATDGNPRVNPRLKAAGAAVGIDFSGKTDRYPNTTQAHALMDFALQQGGTVAQNKMAEVLFRHYFTDGLYPDVANLSDAAKEVGLDADDAVRYISDPGCLDKVREEARREAHGINGVPFFRINSQPAFSGAHPPDVFLEAFDALCA